MHRKNTPLQNELIHVMTPFLRFFAMVTDAETRGILSSEYLLPKDQQALYASGQFPSSNRKKGKILQRKLRGE